MLIELYWSRCRGWLRIYILSKSTIYPSTCYKYIYYLSYFLNNPRSMRIHVEIHAWAGKCDWSSFGAPTAPPPNIFIVLSAITSCILLSLVFFFSNPSYFVIVAAQALNCFIMLDVIMPAVQFVAGHCFGPAFQAQPGSPAPGPGPGPGPPCKNWKMETKKNAGKNWGQKKEKLGKGRWMAGRTHQKNDFHICSGFQFHINFITDWHKYRHKPISDVCQKKILLFIRKWNIW